MHNVQVNNSIPWKLTLPASVFPHKNVGNQKSQEKLYSGAALEQLAICGSILRLPLTSASQATRARLAELLPFHVEVA